MSGFEQGYFEANYRNYRAQNPPWKLRYYRRMVEHHAPPGRPVSLLDVGCGLGAFVGSLSGNPDYDLAATDLSAYAIEHNKKLWPGVDFRVASATDRPFADASFDVITAFDVVEHVPDLSEVARAVDAMLKPRGTFLFVVPVYDGLTGPVIRALDRDPTHVHKHPRSFWLRWAQQSFEVLGWHGMLRYLLPGDFYLHLPTKVWRQHTPAVLVACRRLEKVA
ncbi:MAG TPA: class I SAM-dependent methyltransferase [Thermoanaerobaculia bacterium]|nr:class I SAM-dependent methyltransferase [Thermoanaerobaculia bacterium]